MSGVDDVGPVVARLVAAVEQLGCDRVAVGLIEDQHATERVASLRAKTSKLGAEVIVTHRSVQDQQ